MFKNATFFIMMRDKNGLEIKRINITRETQEVLCSMFSEHTIDILYPENELIEFDGRYKSDDGEIQFINDFEIDDSIVDALREPIGVDPFIPDNEILPDIKGIFTGKIEPEIVIAFQKFNRSQFINRKGISLFHNQNTFERLSSFGINVLDNVDCVFSSNVLLFSSYFSARQIFDLSNYYRVATDTDISNFINHNQVYVCNQETFEGTADSWVRRKIALISDSGILNALTANQISEKASEYNLTINLTEQDGSTKLNIPDDKKEIKNILKFLDEDIYRGPLTSATYETNSKRRFNR